MECENVRDKFSSLLEGELNVVEEKALREHLSSCAKCQKEFEQFEKTLRWLHTVEEVEVPEGFLPEILKKMEDRKKSGFREADERSGWFQRVAKWKLPAQATAMVAIVFLALYLSKMIPAPYLEHAQRTKVPPSEAEKVAEEVVQKEPGQEGREARSRLDAVRPKDIEQEKTPVAIEKKVEVASAPKPKEEAKTAEAYPPKARPSAVGALHLKEMEKTGVPSPEVGKAEKDVMQEIVLRIFDRPKALSQLHELVKQFGGEVVKEEENVLLTSLPMSSVSEFEKGLKQWSSLKESDRVAPQKKAKEDFVPSREAVRREAEDKERAPARSVAGKENRVFIRIILLQE